MTKIINIIGTLLIVLTFFIEDLAVYGLVAGVLIMLIVDDMWLIPILIVIGINIAAYFTVYNNKTVPGMILMVFGGGIGGAIAVHRTGAMSTAWKAVITIFQIEMWLLAWLVTGFLLYWYEYYEFSLAIPG